MCVLCLCLSAFVVLCCCGCVCLCVWLGEAVAYICFVAFICICVGLLRCCVFLVVLHPVFDLCVGCVLRCVCVQCVVFV